MNIYESLITTPEKVRALIKNLIEEGQAQDAAFVSGSRIIGYPAATRRTRMLLEQLLEVGDYPTQPLDVSPKISDIPAYIEANTERGSLAEMRLIGRYEEMKSLEFADTWRIARAGCKHEVDEYNRIMDSGCCGSSDALVVTPDGMFLVGCNYGH